MVISEFQLDGFWPDPVFARWDNRFKIPPGWKMTGSDFVSLNFRVDKDTEFRLRLFKKKLEKKQKESGTLISDLLNL